MPTGDLGEQIVLRIDAHFIDVYSRKENAERLRGRYGLHPLAVICDNTNECLADQLRAGNAGANDAADHTAPRGALSYPQHSWEKLEGRFLGLMAYLDLKSEGKRSMPEKDRSCSGV
jgi:hypothetical protein